MALTFKVTGGGDFKTVPSGSHIAVCNLVADLGLQPGSQAYPDPKRKVYIRFEVPAERVQYEKDGKKFEGPQTIGSFFTASMHEKAMLRKRLEGWRGRTFTDDEAGNFDVSTILGKPCMLTVIENVVGDKVYANIASISPLPKGVSAPPAENPLLCFTADDQGCFENLPDWIQEKIKGQLKPKASHATGSYANEQANNYDYGDQGITDEDIPF
jgi:hypothetical protein